jgi:hypothetical protein
MRLLVPLTVVVLAASGCGGAKDVTNLITSTPDAAALQIAETNLTSASSAVNSYFALHGSYDGLSIDQLRQVDAGLDPTMVVTSTSTTYCIQDQVRTEVASLRGPGGAPQAGPC